MKKVFGIILSILLLLNVGSFRVFAEKDEYEAVIGDTNYATIETAITNSEDGQTIKLLSNPEVESQLEISGKNITIDLNGKTINYNGNQLNSGVILIHNGASLTIIDTENDENNGGINAGDKAYAAIALTKKGDDPANPAKLVVNAGWLRGYYYAVTGNGSRNNTIIEINGGALEGTNPTDSIAIFHPQNGTVTINGGSLEGYNSAIEMRAGTLNINGGVLAATSENYSCDPNGSGSTTVGAAIAIAQHTTKKDLVLNITDGEFNGEKALSESNPQENDPAPQVSMSIEGGEFYGDVVVADSSKFITGGIFDYDESEYCADPLKASYSNEHGMYEIVVKDAAIEDTYYSTLNDAIASITDNTKTTININRDIQDATGISVPSNRNIVIDFNGHTYEVTKPGEGSYGTKTQAFQLLKDSTIVFKNGTIACTSDNKDYTWNTSDKTATKGIAMIIQNYADLTLDNMVIDGTNIAHNGNNVRYVVSNNSGTVNIKNGSEIKAVSGDFAFDSCKYGSYAKPTVNVTASTITGKVEASGGDINFENGTVVNGQVRVGENKSGGATGSTVNVKNGATINNEGNYALVAFGANTVNIEGAINGIVGTNGNAYNAGSVININNGANIINTDDVAIYVPNGTLNITGGTIEGATAVYFKSTVLNITGGTLIGTGLGVYKFNPNGADATGDALVIDNCNYPSGLDLSNLTISGGNFESKYAKEIGSYCGNGKTEALKGFVTGGYYKEGLDLDLVKDGYTKTVSDKSGYKFMVKQLTDSKVKVTETVSSDKSNLDIADKALVDLDKVETEDVSSALKTDVKDSIINNAKDNYVGEINKIELKVILNVTASKSNITGAKENEKTLVFEVHPVAQVYINNVKQGSDIAVNNSNLNGTKIKVTLPTGGIEPTEIVHRSNSGTIIEKFSGSDMNYDSIHDTVTVEINSFSSIEINSFITPIPTVNPSTTYTVVKTSTK